MDVAEDGERGQRRLRHARPDIAIIDLMLPGRDGWPVTETIRDEHLGVPVIVVSGRGSGHDRLRFRDRVVTGQRGLTPLSSHDPITKPGAARERLGRYAVDANRVSPRRGTRPPGEACSHT